MCLQYRPGRQVAHIGAAFTNEKNHKIVVACLIVLDFVGAPQARARAAAPVQPELDGVGLPAARPGPALEDAMHNEAVRMAAQAAEARNLQLLQAMQQGAHEPFAARAGPPAPGLEQQIPRYAQHGPRLAWAMAQQQLAAAQQVAHNAAAAVGQGAPQDPAAAAVARAAADERADAQAIAAADEFANAE